MRHPHWPRLAQELVGCIGLGSASMIACALCGCSWKDVFPVHPTTIPNAEAVSRALQLCSLTTGDQPFHLVLEIEPPGKAADSAQGQVPAQVEVFWLNPITYRTVIRSSDFTQTRIVNGQTVEEHNTGDFYPRWIENFVQAILEPIPGADMLRKESGSVPVGVQEHACIARDSAQVCFQDAEPRIATGSDPSRSIWFEDYAPFGRHQIARTLVDNLPGNLLVRGHIVQLTPLRQSDYPLLKAVEFTPPDKLIQTESVSGETAASIQQVTPANSQDKLHLASETVVRLTPAGGAGAPTELDGRVTVYIRTDKTGRVREAYRDGVTALQDGAAERALTLRFKPLIVDGAPRQMEATVAVP